MFSLTTHFISGRRTLFVLPLLCILMLYSPAPAQPPQFLSIAGPSTAPMVTWSDVPGATGYHFQLSTDASFTTLVLDDSMVYNTVKILESLQSLTGYYCRIAGVTESGATEWSGTLKFFGEADKEVFMFSEAAGWNLLSMPVDMSDTARNFIFPGSCMVPTQYCYFVGYGYDCCGSYAHIRNYGFWNSSPERRILGITGIPLLADTLDILDGWNLIGSPITPVAVTQIMADPPGLLISRLFAYTHSGYLTADSLRPFEGYWIRANGPGRIIIPQPPDIRGTIIAYVHWEDQPVQNKKIVLVQTGDTAYTDARGMVQFSVPPGKYGVEAYEINRGGPIVLIISFTVEVKSAGTALIDIIDCLPCL